MTATATKLTYDDYVKLPDDGKRYEVLDGELFVNPSPVPRHQVISGNLYRPLHEHVGAGGIVLYAPIDVVLAPDRVVQPDIVVILNDRLEIVGPRNIQGPPHVAIEVLSEGTRHYDAIRKRRLYESAGIDEYWVADPELEMLRIYRLERGAYVLSLEIDTDRGGDVTSTLLAGFSLPVEKVFASAQHD